MKRILACFLTLCIFLSSLIGFSFAEGADGVVVINILHTNDMHGSGIANASEKMIRYSQIATMKKQFENAILVDGGDFTQGSVYVAMTDGLGAINAMRLAGYDVTTLGNHEFTANRSHFISSLISESGEELVGSPMAVVAGNVLGDEVLDTQPDWCIIEREGVKVSFFGLATPTTLTTGNPAVNVGITIGNIIDAAQDAVDHLKDEGADVIVGVTHLGYDPEVVGKDGDSSNCVAENVEGIDVIIDAHFHQSMMGADAKQAGDTLIVSSGTGAAAVGNVEITVDADTGDILSCESEAITAADAFANYAEDQEVKDYLDRVCEEVDSITGRVFANISMGLYGGHYRNGENVASIARRGETNAVSLEADGRLREAKRYFEGTEYEDLPIVSLVCGGSCRTAIPAGDVSVAQIMDLSLNAGMDPSGVYVKTTGAVLWETVEWGLSCLIAQDPETGAISADGSYHGRYPNLAGAVYTYDIRKEGSTPLDFDPETYKMGSRLVSLTLDDGTEITKDSDVELILCTNEFELGGGDGYFCLQRAEEAGQLTRIGVSPISFLDATVDYMTEIYEETGDVYYPLTSGRVTVISDYDKEEFTSVVTVLDAAEAPVANTQAELFVNYGTEEGVKWVSMGVFTTDDNGQFSATLKKGPQETKVVIDGQESTVMYVDNIAGMLDTTLTMK